MCVCVLSQASLVKLTDSCTHWCNLLKLQIEIFAFYLRNANAAHPLRGVSTPFLLPFLPRATQSIWANNAKQIGYSNPQTTYPSFPSPSRVMCGGKKERERESNRGGSGTIYALAPTLNAFCSFHGLPAVFCLFAAAAAKKPLRLLSMARFDSRRERERDEAQLEARWDLPHFCWKLTRMQHSRGQL